MRPSRLVISKPSELSVVSPTGDMWGRCSGFLGDRPFFLVREPGLGLVALCLQPPWVTLQLPSVTLQPPSATLQPPSVTLHPPSVTLQPPSVALQPPSVTFQPLSVTPEVPSVGAVQILLTTRHARLRVFFLITNPPGAVGWCLLVGCESVVLQLPCVLAGFQHDDDGLPADHCIEVGGHGHL